MQTKPFATRPHLRSALALAVLAMVTAGCRTTPTNVDTPRSRVATALGFAGATTAAHDAPARTAPVAEHHVDTEQLPAVWLDPANFGEVQTLRLRARNVLGELVGALPEQRRHAVQAIPLQVDARAGEVNAYAICRDSSASMVVTDGLLKIMSQLARAKATDAVFGTSKLAEYQTHVARNHRAGHAVPMPPLGFFNLIQDADSRKLQVQQRLLDEALAFVLGHELAHHYLGHTGCVGTSRSAHAVSHVGHMFSDVLPALNQPHELAADVEGVDHLLTSGVRHGWTEGGALLTLDFFQAMHALTPPEAVLFGFQLSHPHPYFRKPVVSQTANHWRARRRGGWPQLPF